MGETQGLPAVIVEPRKEGLRPIGDDINRTMMVVTERAATGRLMAKIDRDGYRFFR
jgi:hypothetical protein